MVNDSVIPWLLVSVVNVSRNLRRSTSRYRRFLSTAPRGAAVDAFDVELIEMRERLGAALKQLSSVDSALLVLTVLEGVPIAEAAQAVGIKPATARVRLHRARGRLQADLRDLDPRPTPAEGIS